LSSLPATARTHILAALSQDMTWQQHAELTVRKGIYTDDFGVSVAISGNTVVVGAPYATIGSNKSQGAAYLFVKPKGGWKNMTQTAKLTASDGGADSYFGSSVAIDGGTVLIGSEGVGPFGAYIFVKPARGWKTGTETVELPNADLCSAVGISGDTAVCARGTALVYVKPKSGWKSIQGYDAELMASDDSGYGFSTISIDQNTIVAGDTYVNNGNGGAYVFVKPSSGWHGTMTQTAKLTASDAFYYMGFAGSLSVTRNTVAVGGPYAMNGAKTTGAVYIFVKPSAGWMNMNQTAKLFASPQQYYCGFGFSVAIRGGTLVVGAILGDFPLGATYVYLRPLGGWTSTGTYDAMFSALDGQTYDNFGWSVSLSGKRILVGSNKLGITQPGAAYVFEP
jgi:hypothetical protein